MHPRKLVVLSTKSAKLELPYRHSDTFFQPIVQKGCRQGAEKTMLLQSKNALRVKFGAIFSEVSLLVRPHLVDFGYRNTFQ